MKQLFINRLTGAGYSKMLCRPIGYAEKQDTVCSKEFPANGYSIAMRPFCLNTDFTFAYEWMRRAYAPRIWQTNSAVKQLEETYSLMLQSDFAQPFVVLVNKTPICLADVYHGKHHELSLYYDLKPDDFVIQFLMGPRKKKEHALTACILQTCIEYCFSFSEVKRLISEPNVWDKDLNEAMVQAGFKLIQKIDMVYKTSNLYELLPSGTNI